MKIKYRPDIDGLRAIAVISIIIYHSKIKIFNINFFSGGFLGVDIFLLFLDI
jgi:peptidoglycan/LPS O-acetylase OafA/YrhL